MAKQLHVTKSLSDALRNVRDRLQQRIIWIDGVCIDQSESSLLERAAQVESMRVIFSNAQRVLAQLDHADTEVKKAFKVIRDLIAKLYISESGKARTVRALHDATSFFQLPFWRRVWILPEIILAKDLILMVGNKSITWRSFEDKFFPLVVHLDWMQKTTVEIQENRAQMLSIFCG